MVVLINGLDLLNDLLSPASLLEMYSIQKRVQSKS